MKKRSVNNISAEVFAAFLDGNATAQESKKIFDALTEDAGLRELMHISQSVDAELGMTSQECEFIPMTAMAATCNEENYCCLECEKYILRSKIQNLEELKTAYAVNDKGEITFLRLTDGKFVEHKKQITDTDIVGFLDLTEQI